MAENEPFYARRRLKELRSLIRDEVDFDHKGRMHKAMVALLNDLAEDLARRAEGDNEEAFHFIIRCMGAIAEANAADAYAPYGYRNPFAPAATTAEPKPPAAPIWKWPVINKPPPGRGGSGLDGDFNAYSALRMFGYTVGKTKGWEKEKRQSFLSDFMTMVLPGDVTAVFGDDYGKPMSTDRLKKVADVIASNATLRYRNDPLRYSVAIADWEDDLAFLKRKFYDGAGLKFQPWPTTRPS
jgi:hypothetical protein